VQAAVKAVNLTAAGALVGALGVHWLAFSSEPCSGPLSGRRGRRSGALKRSGHQPGCAFLREVGAENPAEGQIAPPFDCWYVKPRQIG